jgi:hypothetical protein
MSEATWGLLLVLLGLSATVFWIWTIVDCLVTEPKDSRLPWTLVVVLFGWIGALIYVFVRRPERIRQYGK